MNDGYVLLSFLNSEMQRPDWLVSRLRTMTVEEQHGPRLHLLRQPKGPDGTRGFKTHLRPTNTVSEPTNGHSEELDSA